MRTSVAPPSGSPVCAVTAFLAAGLLVLSLVGGVLAVVQRDSAEREAVRQARELTALQARNLVEPVLTDAALRPGGAYDALDRVVRGAVMSGPVVRVKLWREDGVIVYSDERSLLGQRFTLSEVEQAVFRRGGRSAAEVSDPDQAANPDEAAFGRLLQVYHRVRTAEGTPLLYETYQPYDEIVAASRRLWTQSVQVLIGGLALLWLAQAPLAWRLATRLKASQEQREQLLLSILAASDRERQRIASDLHDGVVQGLSGASYDLSAAAGRADTRGDLDSAGVMHTAAVGLRQSVRELRSLVVTITPPGLARQPLVPSLHDLVAPLQDKGIHVTLELDDVEVDEPTRDLVLRAAQEAVRNVLRHAAATEVQLCLTREGHDVVLEVRDDGVGFASDAPHRTGMGLSLLGGLARQDGGRLQVDSAPGRGTRLVLHLPRRHARVPG